MYELHYHPLVLKKDLPKLSLRERAMIEESIQQKLTKKPDVFGKPLKQSLRGHRTLRIGKYRVVFRIADNTVIILGIDHRSVVYKRLEQRLKDAL